MEIIDLLSENLAVVSEPSSKGTGNETDMEQILKWNPEVIIFGTDSVYGSIAADELWQKLDAVKNGSCYRAPQGPYNWMGFPPSVQRYLGLLRLVKSLYPELADYDLYSEVSHYFELFYHSELSREQFYALTAGSVG